MSFNPASPLSAAVEPARTDSTRGIAFMALGFFIFAAVDTQAKFLTATLHPIQIVWTRQLGLFLGVLVLLAVRGLPVLKTRSPLLQMSRGFLAVGSASLFIIGISFVPLADATAITFVAPLIVTVLGALVLREPVGPRRWAAVAIGFIGMLIVVRPGMGVIDPAALFILLAATCFALRQILSRVLSGEDSIETTVAYTALAGSFAITLPLPFFWHWPGSTQEIVLLVSIALMTAVGELMVIKALMVAQAVVVAPVQYMMILWATMYGYLVFDQLPDLWTWVGTAIIVASGIYTLQRERMLRRQETKNTEAAMKAARGS